MATRRKEPFVPLFNKGNRVRVAGRSGDYEATVVRHKKTDGLVTVEAYDEYAGDNTYRDVHPSRLTRLDNMQGVPMATARRSADTRPMGFNIHIDNEDLIESNVRDKMDPRYGDADFRKKALARIGSMLNLVTSKGAITERGWEVLNRDALKLEANALAWLRSKFPTVRDEGHDRYGDLVGVLWYDPRNRSQNTIVETGLNERIDMVDSTYGDLANSVWKGVSEFGQSVLGGAINFERLRGMG